MKYQYVKWDMFNPKKLFMQRHKGKYARFTANSFISLDTETSHIEDKEAWLYQWCFSYESKKDVRLLVYGRKPSELVKCFNKIREVNNVDETHRIVIYLHNMSYDYTYIKDWLEKEAGHKGEILAIGSHKLIQYNLDGLLFRCSLKLAMKSLSKWGKELNIKHPKLVGEIDYNTIRFQDSPLYKNDWRYMFRDVIALDECLFKQFEVYNDNVLTVPMTSTGYVRRADRKRFKEDESNRKQFLNQALDITNYIHCKKEFAGGLTHGNRYFRGKTVDRKLVEEMFGKEFPNFCIKHRDFASHYPSQQICGKAPVSRFICSYKHSKEKPMTTDKLLKLINKYCLLINIKITKLEIKKGVTLPTAQICKIKDGALTKLKIVEDNGRALKVDGTFILTLNEFDFKWLVKQYDFNYEIESVYTAKAGKFPKHLRDTVIDFFYQKSYYKCVEKKMIADGISEESEEFKENHLNMCIAKSMLNAIYGMSATDPIRESFLEDENGEWYKQKHSKEEITELLDKYYENKNSFMNFELGCYTTSQARDELLTFAELIGYEYFIYADTDSIFYISTDEIEKRIEELNTKFREEDDKNGWYIELKDFNNKRVYFNQFDDENENIVQFRFLHSKCYAYVLDDGSLHTTIAGVKKDGRNGMTRVKELGSIENLKHGKVFYDCGGTTIKYINRKPQIIDIQGHKTEVASAGIITETDKTLKNDFELEEEFIAWSVADFEAS